MISTNPLVAREIEALRTRLARAEEELAAWRDHSTESNVDKLQLMAFQLRQHHKMPGHAVAMALAVLYTSSRPVSYGVLDELIPPKTSEERNTRAFLSTIVCHARKVVGKDGITTHRAWGYSLTPQGRAVLDATFAVS